MNKFNILGKYLDQSIVTAKFSNAVPKILVGGAIAIAANQGLKQDAFEERKKENIKNFCVLSATVASALIATRGLKIGSKRILNGLSDIVSPKEVLAKNKKFIERFNKMLKESPQIDLQTKKLFENNNIKALLSKTTKEKLSMKEIKELYGSISENKWGGKLLNKLIPNPHAVDSGHIWEELGRLSLLGAIPVLGGVIGGTVGDRLTEKNWKKKVPNKIKEGAYQYLANIVLCNVGAGAALATLEGLKRANVIKNISSLTRGLSMFGGILATGVIGGSAIANFLSKKIIDPLVNKNISNSNINFKANLYDERHPEPIDIGLHIDDIATVGVMSGFSWIEPALPLLYSISGYRAGIGYRNGDKVTKHHRKHKNCKDNQSNTFNGIHSSNYSNCTKDNDYKRKMIFKDFINA